MLLSAKESKNKIPKKQKRKKKENGIQLKLGSSLALVIVLINLRVGEQGNDLDLAGQSQ